MPDIKSDRNAYMIVGLFLIVLEGLKIALFVYLLFQMVKTDKEVTAIKYGVAAILLAIDFAVKEIKKKK